MLVRTLVCVGVYQRNMLLRVRVDKNFTAIRLRLMEGQDSLVGAHEQVCAWRLCKWMVEQTREFNRSVYIACSRCVRLQ